MSSKKNKPSRPAPLQQEVPAAPGLPEDQSNEEALICVSETMIRTQKVQNLAVRVFNGQGTPEMCLKLDEIATKLIASIKAWQEMIPG